MSAFTELETIKPGEEVTVTLRARRFSKHVNAWDGDAFSLSLSFTTDVDGPFDGAELTVSALRDGRVFFKGGNT